MAKAKSKKAVPKKAVKKAAPKKKPVKLILDIEDDDMNLFKKEYVNLIDLHEEIEKLFEEGAKIDKRKKRVYQEWREKINFLITMYNTKCKFKSFNKV